MIKKRYNISSKKEIVFLLILFVLLSIYFMEIRSIPFFNTKFSLPFWVKYISIGFMIIGIATILMGVFSLKDKPSFKRENLFKGIYKYIRNPIYAGLFLCLLFYSIYSLSFIKIGVTLLLGIVFYFKTKLEEDQLIKEFPKFSIYKSATGMFFPKVKHKKK